MRNILFACNNFNIVNQTVQPMDHRCVEIMVIKLDEQNHVLEK
jgi:hypothetical protein